MKLIFQLVTSDKQRSYIAHISANIKRFEVKRFEEEIIQIHNIDDVILNTTFKPLSNKDLADCGWRMNE